MDNSFLNIFPQGSLASSVTTTVFVGVIVSTFFNLRLGWVLSGLVVPGYIVPLIISKPWAAVSVFIEGIVTYLIVWLFSEYLSKPFKWNNLFGRDRFFALLLISLFVRILFDVFLLPYIGEMINNRFYVNFDYRNNLHSFGLIIVALIANQFWKPGLRRGLLPLIVTVGITYLIVRFVLMEYTNFTISNLSYVYEDIAASMLASPKAYIILITTSLVASRMNLLYGWEFSGILIPSLLALQWYNPAKIAASIIESLIILSFGILVLRLPLFKRMTIEGARKILLFFSISFVYKYILSYIIIWLLPQQKITDFFGFGYLLPTLIAIKMHEKSITLKVARAVVQVSLVSVIVASIIGYSLTYVKNPWIEGKTALEAESEDKIARLEGVNLIDIIRKDKVAIYQTRGIQEVQVPIPQEIETFSRAIRMLLHYTEKRDEELLGQAQRLLKGINYKLFLINEKYLYIKEDGESKGRGIYAIDTMAKAGPLVEVPAPLDEWAAVEAGTRLFILLQGRALAVSGASIKGPDQEPLNVLTKSYTFFHKFHEEMAHRNVLQVRGYTIEKIRILSGIRPGGKEIEPPEPKTTLWVKSELPPGLDLAVFKDLIRDIKIEWGKTPFNNIQRDSTPSGFAEIFINRADLRRILFKTLPAGDNISVQLHQQRIDGYLQDWLLNTRGIIAEKGSDLYVEPKLEELLLFDEEVLAPLIKISKREYSEGRWSEQGSEELRIITSSASLLGYKIIMYRDRISEQDYIILLEDEGLPKRRYWGTYVLRLGASGNYIIEIPRPLYELHVFEYGVSMFERMKARALLIGGTHPYANADQASDLIMMQNKANLFNLANQVILREAGNEAFMTIQCRSLGIKEGRPMSTADVLLAFDNGTVERKRLSALGAGLIRILEEDELNVRFVDGTVETSGYEAGFTAPLFYLEQSVNKELAMLWLSPFARETYRQQTENKWQQAEVKALGIQTVEDLLYSHIIGKRLFGDASAVPPNLILELQEYIDTQDIINLKNILHYWPDHRIERLIDINSKQSFLLVYSPSGRLILIANLLPRESGKTLVLDKGDISLKNIVRFVDSRASNMTFRGNFEIHN
jgi:gamma-polyglutamate biosynthesis protein CapC